MATLWYVFRDDERLGPWTSKEIRVRLRHGDLDPFDMVCAQGSQVKQELVQVDEIFAAADDEDTAIESVPAAATQTRTPETGTVISSMPSHQEKIYDDVMSVNATSGSFFSDSDNTASQITELPPAPQSPDPEGEITEIKDSDWEPADTAFRSPSTTKKKAARSDNSDRAADAKREPKRFFLHDRQNRILGPLSAKEIQSLYFRGILDPSVKVVKKDSKRKVALLQFIAVYTGARYQEFKSQHVDSDPYGSTTDGLPSAKVTNEMAQIARLRSDFQSSGVSFLSLAAVAIATAILYFLVEAAVSKGWLNGIFGEEDLRPTHRVEQPLDPQSTSRERDRVKPRKPVQSKPTKTIKRTVEKRVEPRKPAPRKPKKVTPPPKRTVRKRQTPTKRVAVNKPAPIRAKPNKPKPPRRTGGGNSIASLAAKSGVVTVGPVRFSKSQVKNCAFKCELRVSDGSGSMTLSFFKAKFEDKLLKSRGSVTVTGTIVKKGGQTVMYVQKVR